MTRRAVPKKQARAKVKKPLDPALLKDGVPATARLIGYARVSTDDQNLDVQLAALEAAGVKPDDLYVEKISAVNAKRPMFSLMMKCLERGDNLVIHSLSRLGRNVVQIHSILAELTAEGVTWRSITEPHLDNSTAAGRLMLNITAAMAQHERDQVIDRTRRGMAEAKRQGQFIGRQAMFNAKQAKQIKRDRKKMTAAAAAKKWKCSPATIDKYAS